MGRPKLLLPIGGEPTIRRTVRRALEACSSVVVVTGSGAEDLAAALEGLPGIVVLKNPDWAYGMVGSAQTGAKYLSSEASGPIEGFFIHHGDMPFVDPGVFDALLAAWDQAGRAGPAVGRSAQVLGRKALAAACSGRAGHPVLFPASRLPALLALSPGERLKGVLEDGGFNLVETLCDGVIEDIDNPADYARLLDKYGFPDCRVYE